jgi:hypothetical protein
MEDVGIATILGSYIPFVLVLMSWVGTIAVVVWAVLLLQRIARALETMAAGVQDGSRRTSAD